MTPLGKYVWDGLKSPKGRFEYDVFMVYAVQLLPISVE